MKRLKPIRTDELVRWLRSSARELHKPYERRCEDFEEDAVVWTMREAAKRLVKLEATIERMKAKWL